MSARPLASKEEGEAVATVEMLPEAATAPGEDELP